MGLVRWKVLDWASIGINVLFKVRQLVGMEAPILTGPISSTLKKAKSYFNRPSFHSFISLLPRLIR